MAISPPGSRSGPRSDRASGPEHATAGRRARSELNRAQTRGLDQASIVLSYLIAGVVLWGGAGWLVDRLAGTGHLFTPIGIVIGAGLGCYLIIHRFGALGGDRATPPAEPADPDREDQT